MLACLELDELHEVLVGLLGIPEVTLTFLRTERDSRRGHPGLRKAHGGKLREAHEGELREAPCTATVFVAGYMYVACVVGRVSWHAGKTA